MPNDEWDSPGSGCGASSKHKATEIRFSPSADESGMNIYQRGSDGEEEEEEEDDQRPRSALL